MFLFYVFIRFIYVPAPHTAEALSIELIKCLSDWNVDRKLSTITLDNCSTNDAIARMLLDQLKRHNKMILGGKLLHMRCCAHILNLIVKDGLEVLGNRLEIIREHIAYWVATPKRLEKFEETAKQVRITCKKKLILDCRTRWNSTYLMLTVV